MAEVIDSAESLTRSQFPVYTIYAQKICLSKAGELCAGRPWAYELVPAFQMSSFVREKKRAATRRACMELCLNERTFQCRLISSFFLIVYTAWEMLSGCGQPQPLTDQQQNHFSFKTDRQVSTRKAANAP